MEAFFFFFLKQTVYSAYLSAWKKKNTKRKKELTLFADRFTFNLDIFTAGALGGGTELLLGRRLVVPVMRMMMVMMVMLWMMMRMPTALLLSLVVLLLLMLLLLMRWVMNDR